MSDPENGAEALLQAALNPETMQTDFIPIPIGQYPMTVKKYGLRTYPNADASKSDTVMLDFILSVDSPEVAKEVERDEPTTKCTVFLNFKSDGSLADNNIGLGRLLEACDQKDGTDEVLKDTLDSLIGCSIAGTVSHRMYEGDTFDEVKLVENSSVLDE